jgi:diamine N-acetyltransferase
MSAISILPASHYDLENLVDLSRKVFYDSFNHMNTPENMKEYMDRAFNADQLLSELKNPMSEFYLLSVDDIMAGYLKLNKDTAQSDIRDETSLEIERIYIDQAFQGKGLGAVLMTKAVERARALNLQYIWLGVWEKNTDAKRFYERHGFIEFGSHEFRMGDDVQTDILMRRETVRE